ESNTVIKEDQRKGIIDTGIEKVTTRYTSTSHMNHVEVNKFYDRNLATRDEVDVGEAVDSIAALSIGDSVTPLTLLTYHTGRIAGDDISLGLPRIQEVFEARNPIGQAVISEVYGTIHEIKEVKDKQVIVVQGEVEQREYAVPYNARLKVAVGDEVIAGQELTEGSVEPKELLAVREVDGVECYLLMQ